MPQRRDQSSPAPARALVCVLCLALSASGAAQPEVPRIQSLRAAINDLIATFGDRYPRGDEFLARLPSAAGSPAALAKLQREALIGNPLVSGRPILFVVRAQYRPDHHNTATMFQTGQINTGSFRGPGALKVIDLAKGGKVTALVAAPRGIARDPEVHFGGRKIVFAMRKDIKDDYHIYEVNADGSGLKQLTFSGGVSDIDPVYLPDGGIAFTSTREPKYCMCNRHIMGNLFRMDGDGANMQQIGKSTLHEGHGALTPDGRIIYNRWEYVDRNFGDAQGLWTVNPDGTNHAVYWGNNTNSPGAVLDARIIPGTQRAVCTFSSCHDRPWGAIAVIDRQLGIDGRPPVKRTWPAGAIDLVGKGNFDTFRRVNPKYEDPFPLSSKYFLCSRTSGQGEKTGIYLIDVFGNEVLLHAEGAGCFDPMPLGPRPRPPTVPGRTDLARAEGRFYLYDAYLGTGMDRVKRPAVKYLRIVESPEKRFWSRSSWNGSGTQAPGMAWDDFNNKRIIGTVPVEADGSAYFTVPADRFVYFQLLDENKMMIQSMRSGTIARPGETTGCIGCHENRLSAVPNNRTKALTRPPSRPTDWHGRRRLFGYPAEVQPVLNKYCVRCHDYGKRAGGKLNLAGDKTLMFNVSYHQLRSTKLVKVPGAGPHQVLMPYSWGSHASKLIKVVRRKHKGVKLDPESFERLAAWIDINAPYYPSYATAYRANLYGRCPLNNGQLAGLSKLTGCNLWDQKQAAQVSFDRPELSPCLVRLKKGSRQYREAVAIIAAGRKMLAQRPRADMPGFVPDQLGQRRQAEYLMRRRIESANRRAILAGRKVYDFAAGF